MRSTARENYLKKIFELQELQENDIVGLSLIAKELGLTAGSVTSMVKKLAAADLLEYKAYAGCRLTKRGRELAVSILRSHRIIELFLVKIIGLDWTEVHDEADRIEHAISPRVLDGIDRLLGFPEFDPHGDPIPSADGKIARQEHTRLSDCSPGDVCEIVRILDESREFLSSIGAMKLFPGTRIQVDVIQTETEIIKITPENSRTVAIGLVPAEKLLIKPL